MEKNTTRPAPILLMRAENVSTVYFRNDGKPVNILKNISAEFYQGKTTAIIGESGSGKTTLALALARLIMPWEGKITDGKVILNLDGKEVDLLSIDNQEEILKIRGKEIVFIPQDASSALNPVIKISGQMYEAIKNTALSSDEKKSLIQNALQSVKLPAERVMNSYPHQLSGGQKQRVMIAIALLNSPKVIIADEPTAGLDAAVAREIIAIFSNLINSKSVGQNATFIFITHDLRTAASLADYAIILYAGKVCEVSGLKSIIRSPKHPYTQGLMESLPDIEKISKGIKPLEGSPPAFTTEKSDSSSCPFAPRCRYKMEICLKKSPPLFTVASKENENHKVACFLYERRTI